MTKQTFFPRVPDVIRSVRVLQLLTKTRITANEMARLCSAIPAIKSLIRDPAWAFGRVPQWQFNLQHVSCCPTRSISAAPSLRLRASDVDAHLLPTTSTSGSKDDVHIPFEESWAQSSPSGAGVTAGDELLTTVGVYGTLRELLSNPAQGEMSSRGAKDMVDDLEPDIELRQDTQTGVDKLQHIFRGVPADLPSPFNLGSEEPSVSHHQSSQRDTAVDVENAVVELTPEGFDVIASEMARARSSKHTPPPAESTKKKTARGPSSRTTKRQPGEVKISSSVKSMPAAAEASTPEPQPSRPAEPWQVQKAALEKKFGEVGWQPRKRLSPDALEGIRALHAQYPDKYTTPVLANQFEVSPEAIRRILRSKWRPSEKEAQDRRERWEKRGEKIWSQKAELGLKPPRKWREKGIGRGRPPRSHTPRRDTTLASSRSRPEKQRSPSDESHILTTKPNSAPLGERIF